MAKRTFPPGAFALPGLSKDTKKTFGVSSTRDGCGLNSASNVSRTNARGSKSYNSNDSSSLVDERGCFLPPHTEHTLENLTKTRPRSPGRRSPSPLARRKLEHDSNLSSEADKTQTPIKDHKDVKSLKERLNASPALILSNDVGLSVSSNELSPVMSRASPRIGNKNRTNRPEVPPKPDRSRIRANRDAVAEKSASNATRDPKILFGDDGDHADPPPLPSSPPPLEDDEILGSLANETLSEEVKHSLKASELETTAKSADNINFDISTKVGNVIKSPSEVNGLYRTTNDYYSSSSRIAKWQGYGRNSSEDSLALSMQKIGTSVPKIGTGIPDRQSSLDSAITSRLSKYETPYNSRQRKPVEKSLSANRRRFKPVTLTESEEMDSENNKGNLNSSMDFRDVHTNQNQPTPERLDDMQVGKKSLDSLPRDVNKETDVKSQPLSLSGSTKEHEDSFMPGGNVKRIAGHSSVPSVTSTVINIDKSRQGSGSPDLSALRRTTSTSPEPSVVVEYESNNHTERVSDGEGKRKVTSVSSDVRNSNRIEPNEFKGGSSIINENEIKEGASNSNGNSTLAKEHESLGLTLPRVVIEYDGVVVNDPLIDGYDTEETSDEGKKMMSSSIGETKDSYIADEIEDMSDGSLDSEDDIVLGDYGISSDEDDVEDITLGDEDGTFDESEREKAEKTANGIEDPEKDDDGLINEPLQIISEVSELEESDDAEVLFEPPPMFASSDEGEVKDELEEPFIMENGYEGDLPSPVIPSSLLEEQPRDDNRFHNLALEVWTEDDCLEWLEYIGLGHFTPEFREHHVDGKVLKNINFQLLEEIGINSPDEREVILSEIYRRFHPEEEDLFEMEIQGALQSASEQEKMKIMAVLNALRSPAFQAELGLTSSTGSSSPRDSDTGHHMASETASLSSSMTGSEGHSQDLGMPPPPPPPSWSQSAYSADSLGRDLDGHDLKSKGGKSKKHGKTSKEKDKSGEKASKSEKQANKQKKHKRVSKLLDSLSLSSGSSKLTKLFHHSHSSSSSSSATKKLNPAMQYLLQAGPQGLLRIWPTALSEEMNYCSFMVNMTTTCAEIIKLVFVKYEVVDDPRRFYVCEMALGKGGSHHDLTDSDCPLLYQCRWADPDKQRFELRCRNEGVIKMLFELEGYEDDLDYRSIPLSSKTPCSEAVGIIVKKFDLPGNASEYYLMEVSEENEDDREEVADHVCPLRLQIAWSAPDHVFRLCRRPTEVKEEEHKDTLDGWTTDATEEISPEPGINSEVSSVRDEDELEFAPGAAGSIEGDEIVEEISDDLMEGLSELDHVIDEESEAIPSHELEAVRQELAAKEEELRELRVRSDTLTEREDEIEVLRRENEELRRRSEELGELTRSDESLVEKDRALEERRRENDKLRQRIEEIEEKFNNEISMRDREIERLYARNNELSSHEKELENLRRLRDDFESQGNELERLRVLNEEYSSSESELALKLGELQEKHDELLTKVGEMEKLKEINRDLSHKAEESELLQQKLDRSEAEKKELIEKVNESERAKNDSVRTGTVEVENLKKENLELAAKCKDADEMKTNIIKLTAQMREMETQSQEQMDHFQEKLEDLVNEKQQLLDRIAELEEREKNAETQENSAKEVEDLKLENIFLVERTKEVDELKSAVAKLTADAKENESFKQKYKELRDVESYLTKQVNAAETIARQKDKKLKESENKINTLTEAVKDMEAKLEEQEQNKMYLDQLLAMLKDRDPTLLHVINSSLAQSEPEEWC